MGRERLGHAALEINIYYYQYYITVAKKSGGVSAV
jgi:hypothetical protein